MQQATQASGLPTAQDNETSHRRVQSRRNVKPFYPPPSSDIDTPWTINVYSATHEPERWERYNQAANESYAARGLQSVGEEQRIDIERYPTYFAEASLDGCTLPIGGVRIHLPDCDGKVPLLDELEGYTDTASLQKMIDELRPEGISHGGGLWIGATHARSGLAGDLARACNVMVVGSMSRSYIAATHQHSLAAWQSLGWYPSTEICAFAYPDERYITQVLLGGIGAWPQELYTWATSQAGEASLDGAGARFTIKPMRMEQATITQ